MANSPRPGAPQVRPAPPPLKQPASQANSQAAAPPAQSQAAHAKAPQQRMGALGAELVVQPAEPLALRSLARWHTAMLAIPLARASFQDDRRKRPTATSLSTARHRAVVS